MYKLLPQNVYCMVFNVISSVFQLYCSYQCTYPGIPVLLTSTLHNILSKALQTAFPHNVKTKDSGERGMNTVANPWKEYWPSPGSNQ